MFNEVKTNTIRIPARQWLPCQWTIFLKISNSKCILLQNATKKDNCTSNTYKWIIKLVGKLHMLIYLNSWSNLALPLSWGLSVKFPSFLQAIIINLIVRSQSVSSHFQKIFQEITLDRICETLVKQRKNCYSIHIMMDNHHCSKHNFAIFSNVRYSKK